MGTGERKGEHIRVCAERDVEFREKGTGLEDVSFRDVELVYQALPEADLCNVNTETEFMGKEFGVPLMVSAITGGTEEAKEINLEIAAVCEELGIGFGLGSQRAMLEDPEKYETYKVRGVAPTIFVAGNIGAVQLKEYSADRIAAALEDVGADALAIHLNAAQEAVQKEGTTDFSGCVKEIGKIASKMRKPVYVKEVGAGISMEVAKRLTRTKIKAIDVQGAGGTSWTAVEYERLGEEEQTFREFGIPTAASILEVKKGFKRKIVASGGIRNGLDCVKGIVLGADMCGIALPVLRAQQKSGKEEVKKYLARIVKEIKTGMFLVGAGNIKELKKKKYVLQGRTLEWARQRKL